MKKLSIAHSRRNACSMVSPGAAVIAGVVWWCCTMVMSQDVAAQQAVTIEEETAARIAAQVSGLRARALTALQSGNLEDAVTAADAMVRLGSPDDTRTNQLAADIYLRCGQAKWAVRLFDRVVAAKPSEMPHLWQRGIALYFNKDFQAGVEQFEQHQKVNPHDVENAAWHFLCLAKAVSPEEAKKRVLPAPNDPRVPMEEVLQMLRTGNTQGVIDRMQQVAENSPEHRSAEFYGNFYLGLYADAMGNPKEAKTRMQQAADDAPRNYMGDVARVYADWLTQSSE